MHNGRIHTLEELAEICANHRKAGKRIAHCHGAFDLLHPGHVAHLQAARAMADVLVVTLTEDRYIKKGPGRPVYNEQVRAKTIAAIQVVDHVATCPHATAIEALGMIKPDFYVKGQDYRDRSRDVTGAIVEEEKTVEGNGGRLVCTDEIQFSSTQLLNDHFGVLSDEQRNYLKQLKQRYTAGDVLATLDQVKSTSVLVVGEAIFDEYHYCMPDAMSNKSPTLSVRFESEEIFAGGVVAVGNHLAGLCGSVTLLAGAGIQEGDGDEFAPFLRDGVEPIIIRREDSPTIRKRRFVHRFSNQKMFEVTFLNDRPISDDTQHALLTAIDEHAQDVDLVLVLDFGHGFITEAVVKRLRSRSKFLAVNAQINSSNRGYNTARKYKGADYISVDEHELRLPYGDRYGPLHGVIKALSDETGCNRINVTLGDRGTLYYDGKTHHHAPVLVNGVLDTMGAGDALMAVTALLVHADVPGELVPFIGNCMGGLMTRIVGHREPVGVLELRRFMETLLK